MSEPKNKIKLFEERQVRAVWDEEAEKWWFSVVDIVSVLTDSDYQRGRKYWKVLKGRLSEEGNETVTNCYQLKMTAPDGKMRLTDVGDTEQVLRLLNMLAEVAATDISIVRQPSGFNESAMVAKEGANAAKAAREQIEKSTGIGLAILNQICSWSTTGLMMKPYGLRGWAFTVNCMGCSAASDQIRNSLVCLRQHSGEAYPIGVQDDRGHYYQPGHYLAREVFHSH